MIRVRRRSSSRSPNTGVGFRNDELTACGCLECTSDAARGAGDFGPASLELRKSLPRRTGGCSGEAAETSHLGSRASTPGLIDQVSQAAGRCSRKTEWG